MIAAAGAGSVVAVGVSTAVVTAALGDVDFATDDGLDAAGGGFMGEIGGGEEIAVVSDRNSGHAAARCLVQHLGHVAGAVEEREVRVQMKMNEIRMAHDGKQF